MTKKVPNAKEQTIEEQIKEMPIDVLVKIRPELSAADGQEIADDMLKLIEDQKIKISELEEKIVALNKKLEVSLNDTDKASGVIVDSKKLDEKKSYVTGPNGVGFVEA